MIDAAHIARHKWAVLKVALHIVEGRRQRLAEYFQHHSYAPLQEVCARFKISTATARRDLAVLASQKQIVRTYGGALPDYNQRFASFRERETLHADAKRRIALAAHGLIEPGDCCYLDFGTTAYALAIALRARPVADLKIITNSLPVVDLLASVPQIRVHILGGEVLPRQSALLGGAACKAVRFHSIQRAFMSAEAANRNGVWNSQSEVVNLQRTVLAQAAWTAMCLDSSKLRHTAPAFLAPWMEFDLFITDRTTRRFAFAPCEHLAV